MRAETDLTAPEEPGAMPARQTTTPLMDLVPPSGIEAIDEIVQGYQAYQVLVAGLELGCSTCLKKTDPWTEKK